MSDTKRCSGYKGHWECADQYPDHIVPFSEFAMDTYSINGLQNKCRLCQSYHNHIAFMTQRPRHPITSEAKQNWKRRKAIELGGVPNTTQWQSFLDRTEMQWSEEIKGHLLNTAPAEEVLAHIEKRAFPKLRDKKPKFNQGKYKSPLARAVAKSKVKQSPGFAREGPGFVYVYEDEMKMPGVLKIGSTQYSNGRLTSANTWGAFTCLYEKEFERRYEAEAIVHEMLDYCRIYRDKEWFRVTLTVAIEAIGEVRIDIRKKQKMG